MKHINQLLLKSLPSLLLTPDSVFVVFFLIKYETGKLACQYKYVILKEVFKIFEEVEKMGL